MSYTTTYDRASPMLSSTSLEDTGHSGPGIVEETVVSRHATFYFDDQMTIFQIEKRLFKVHRYHFTCGSEIFRDMFRLPSAADVEVDGSSDEKPLVLPDVTVREFEALLHFFYQGMHNVLPLVTYWIDILSISTRFAFDKIRARALKEIEQLRIDAVERITLAQRYNMPSWLPESYADVVRRREPLAVEEAEKIGLTATVLLAKAREIARRELNRPTRSSSPPPPIPSLPDYSDLALFSLQLDMFEPGLSETMVSIIVGEVFWPDHSPIVD